MCACTSFGKYMRVCVSMYVNMDVCIAEIVDVHALKRDESYGNHVQMHMCMCMFVQMYVC